jgi:NhaP-type Na+/H+ or K+/H+ antiporter
MRLLMVAVLLIALGALIGIGVLRLIRELLTKDFFDAPRMSSREDRARCCATPDA